ncbi:hypothetical protein [Leptolyngbya sp. FACHB-17]|uniref:hypothetical protein n=1 Tax=unclassified Leptolyngbya TaxID=2650499 RepID=UPI0016811F1C|nr:hypothetical protein [Leptolyngbya sp. FACHB-17]MBD2080918.1 hypothetical protein [Leptolyngbya sp. FACHB-17]
MSNFYEFALLMTVKPDVSQETIDTLQYMIRGQELDFTSSLNNSAFSQPISSVVQPSGVVMRVAPEWHGFLGDGHNEFEKYMSGSFGSVFSESRLAVRQIIHEDTFFNVWDDLGSWLASISASSGVVGFFRNLEDDFLENINLICFEDGQVFESLTEDDEVIENFLQALEVVLSSPNP